MTAGVGRHDARIHSKSFALDQAGGHALAHDALEEPAESAAFPEATMAVLREGGMIRNGIFQTKPAEPAIGEIEVDFLTQPPLGSDAIAVADDQHP